MIVGINLHEAYSKKLIPFADNICKPVEKLTCNFAFCLRVVLFYTYIPLHYKIPELRSGSQIGIDERKEFRDRYDSFGN